MTVEDRYIGVVVDELLDEMDRKVPQDGVYFFGFTFPLSLTKFLFHELKDFYCVSTAERYTIIGLPRNAAIPFLRHTKRVKLGIEVGGATENLMKCAGEIELATYAMAIERPPPIVKEESGPVEELHQ